METSAWRLLLRSFKNIYQFNIRKSRNLEHEILSFLAQPKFTYTGAYGLDIIEALGITTGAFFPAAQRLERLGLVEGFWVDDYQPRRRFYRLTGNGRDALTQPRGSRSRPRPSSLRPRPETA